MRRPAFNPQQITLDQLLRDASSFSATVSLQNRREVPGIDTSQWGNQLLAVYDAMKSGRWMTLAEVAFHAQAPEASVSARIRDLSRKGIPHAKRRAGNGLYEYRLPAT